MKHYLHLGVSWVGEFTGGVHFEVELLPMAESTGSAHPFLCGCAACDTCGLNLGAMSAVSRVLPFSTCDLSRGLGSAHPFMCGCAACDTLAESRRNEHSELLLPSFLLWGGRRRGPPDHIFILVVMYFHPHVVQGIRRSLGSRLFRPLYTSGSPLGRGHCCLSELISSTILRGLDSWASRPFSPRADPRPLERLCAPVSGAASRKHPCLPSAL